MKRLLAVIAGALGLGALLRRRKRSASPSEWSSEPAEELRAKLAETRTEPEPDAPEPVAQDLNGRRGDVHDRARRAIDELKES